VRIDAHNGDRLRIGGYDYNDAPGYLLKGDEPPRRSCATGLSAVCCAGSRAHISTAEVAGVSVPATLQATIAARIDRLDPKTKRTLSAAAVIGSRFGLDLLTALGVEPVVGDLVAAQLIDQVRFARQPDMCFTIR
jgi:hypothetical protein